MTIALHKKIHHHLDIIYPNHDKDDLTNAIIDAFFDGVTPSEPHQIDETPWDEKTHVLITYADSIQKDGNSHHLKTLHHFLEKNLKSTMTAVHLLPFFPYSSDDGFAVQDYYKVRDDIGDWDDIQTLSQDFTIMSDIVINHASASSEWFKEFLSDNPDYTDFFAVADKDADLSGVVRPRTTPLLTPFETSNGETKHVWCTFGPDQVDFNFENTNVLLAFIKLIRFYLEKNIRIFRLDAVGFLWKAINETASLHPKPS